MQRNNESIRSYIQRWTNIKNSAEDISEEIAIDAFRHGVLRRELREELGRSKPRTIKHLMEISNRWADGEDSIRDDRDYTPEDDDAEPRYDSGRRSSRNNDRHKRRKNRSYKDAEGTEFIAVQFLGNRKGSKRGGGSRDSSSRKPT